MTHTRMNVFAAALAVALPIGADAASGADLKQLRAEMKQLRDAYEQRIDALEKRLQRAEAATVKAQQSASQAQSAAQQDTASAQQRGTSASAFNPEVSLILTGTYSRLSSDPNQFQITGFVPSLGEVGPPPRSFSLGESELTIAANVNHLFRGQATFAVTPENEIEVEEAFLRTLGLGRGFTVKGGRFFSGIGYLNEIHAHEWDFTDAPLPYKAFFANQLGNDGVQLKWVAPTDLFVELGVEAGRGGAFPSTDRNTNGNTLGSVFAHVGGDVGASHSWRAGVSHVRTSPRDRAFDDIDSSGSDISNAFSGRSRTTIADFVYKWAPNGNPKHTNFKLQGEYVWRKENGTLASNSAVEPCAGDCSDSFSSRQQGWYLQGIYQFMPYWRVGLRHDRLRYGTVDVGLIENGLLSAADLPLLQAHSPSRNTVMLDWSPSEFSRLRLQYAQDKSRIGETDNQLWLQYIMSLGAHGAHRF